MKTIYVFDKSGNYVSSREVDKDYESSMYETEIEPAGLINPVWNGKKWMGDYTTIVPTQEQVMINQLGIQLAKLQAQ